MNALFEECEKKFVTPEIRKQVDMLVDIANRIYDILEKKGLSQKDFARKLGKTEAEVSRWLSGTHNLTIATLAKISVVLGEEIILTPKAPKQLTTHKHQSMIAEDEYESSLTQCIIPLIAA